MRRSRLWTPKCISAANAVRFLLPNFSQKRTPAAGIKTTHFTIWSPPQQSALKHKKTRMTNKPQKAVNVVRLGARFEAVHFFGDESRAPLVCTHVSTSKTKKQKKKKKGYNCLSVVAREANRPHQHRVLRTTTKNSRTTNTRRHSCGIE